MRQTPETLIDPIQWIKDRRYAQTTGGAKRLILDGKLRSESHIVGRELIHYRDDSGAVVKEYRVTGVPAKLRDTLVVI